MTTQNSSNGFLKETRVNRSVNINNWRFRTAQYIDEIICLATLVASGKLDSDSTVITSKFYFESIGEDCEKCPFHERCLAFTMNG